MKVILILRKQRLTLLLNLHFSDCDNPTGKSRDATEFSFIKFFFIIGATEADGVLYLMILPTT